MKNKINFFVSVLMGSIFLLASFTTFGKSNLEQIKILLKNGKYSRAEILVNKSIEDNLNNPELLFYKGIIETNIGKNNQAIDTFRNLTEKFPELPEPFNNLAVLYAEKGQFILAKEILEQAIKTNPSYLTAHINLGDIFTKMASEAYNNALEIDESNNIAITKLSMITQLFNYNPNIKNTKIDSIKVTNKVKDKKPTKKEISEDILNVLDNWRVAWENKNMDEYLSAYASNFQYPNNMTQTSWEKYRTNRITSKKVIEISLSNTKIKFKKKEVLVTFVQNYKSGNLNQVSNKTLVFIEEEGDWLIFKETSR
jgi:tetratricopeptide (TPR) repeat protein|tara:strand:+ start:457 stop:1389 length:933 start_codon:yes stop_codon:yes gene_type:complete